MTTNTKISNYQLSNVKNENFTFAFRIQEQSGKLFVNNTIQYLEPVHFYYVLDDSWIWQEKEIKIIPYKRCPVLGKDYLEYVFDRYNVSLTEWFCIDLNNIPLGGFFDGSFVSGIQVNAKQCRLDKKTSCVEEKTLANTFQNTFAGTNYFYSYLYMEALPEMDEYESPINQHLINRYEMLSLMSS